MSSHNVKITHQHVYPLALVKKTRRGRRTGNIVFATLFNSTYNKYKCSWPHLFTVITPDFNGPHWWVYYKSLAVCFSVAAAGFISCH